MLISRWQNQIPHTNLNLNAKSGSCLLIFKAFVVYMYFGGLTSLYHFLEYIKTNSYILLYTPRICKGNTSKMLVHLPKLEHFNWNIMCVCIHMCNVYVSIHHTHIYINVTSWQYGKKKTLVTCWHKSCSTGVHTPGAGGSDPELDTEICFSLAALAACGISARQSHSWLMGPITKEQ